MKETPRRVRNHILCYAEDDWLDLPWIASIAFEHPLYVPLNEYRASVMDLIRPLVLEGLLEVGHPNMNWTQQRLNADQSVTKFFPWHLLPQDALNRVDSELLALGRHPEVGDICWLNLTEKGRSYVQTLPPEERPLWPDEE